MRSLIHSLPTLTASLATPQCVAVTAVWAIAFCLMSAAVNPAREPQDSSVEGE
ncbi:hypothetical protein NDI44_00205 [Trichocoleus sp. DQ-A3]|uniref:hypothetical protein n=1 Tax=Cyanophyceae TaxID=3028117 RepID=UPI001684085B|nr:hypothetical protein [Coleofasciculus sp. FACHB-125]MBD1898393.1 hypothetical protein [Coleofasciculus sp. FACHB-125]